MERSAKLNKLTGQLAGLFTGMGALALFVMMLAIVLDVMMRSIMSRVLPGAIDIVGVTLVIVFFSAYADAELNGEHIKVDVLVNKLPPTIQQAIITSGYFLTGVLVTLVTWRLLLLTVYLKDGPVVTAALHIPWWPFVLVSAFFMALFALVLLVSFLKRLTKLLTIGSINTYLWLISGIMVSLVVIVFSIWPNLLPSGITRGTWGIILILFLFTLIFLRVHIFAAMAVTSLFGLGYLSGAEAGLTNLATSIVGVATDYTWSVIPLFVWMGLLVFTMGFARELYETSYKWVGNLPGGLASATVVACAGLAATVGDTLTGVLAMGTISLPEMRKYKYDDKLSTATIATAATIGVLIPPSMIFIVYGMITENSIGKLFLAGIFPGILCSIVFIAMITFRCWKNPKLGPRGPVVPWKQRVVSLKDVWAVVLLIIIVIGGIYAGFFTPTEAGAAGAFGAIIIGIARRRLNLKNLLASMFDSIRLVSTIMIILVFSVAFCRFLAATNIPYDLSNWVIGLGLSRYVIIALVIFIYMVLGCLMPALPAIILTLPMFYPMAMNAGWDPIWFGVIIVIMLQLGTITPPIGLNVFAMAGVAKNVPMYDIFAGVLPFWVAFIVFIAILVAFPQICTFLPSLM